MLVGYPDAVTALQVLTLPTGSGAGGAILKEDWAAITTSNLLDVSGTAVHSVDQIKVGKVDDGDTEEALVVIDGGSFIMFSTSGTTLTNELSMTLAGGLSSVEIEDVDGDGSRDLVLGGGTTLRILWGPDPPEAQADSVPTLGDWQPAFDRLPYDLTGAVPAGYSIEEILVHDFLENDGYADVIVVAIDASGNTIRKVLKVTETEAEARDLSTATETDLELSDESALQILDIKKLDVNNDGGESNELESCARASAL